MLALRVDLGEKIKALRLKKGLSQEELANAVGTTHPTISEIEGGKRNPRVPLLAEIAKFFGVSTDYLLGVDVHEKDVPDELRELFANALSAGYAADVKDFFEWLAAKRNKLVHEGDKIPRQPDEELLALIPDLTPEQVKEVLSKFEGDVVQRIAKLTPEQTKAFNEEVAKILYYLDLEAKVKKGGELTESDR